MFIVEFLSRLSILEVILVLSTFFLIWKCDILRIKYEQRDVDLINCYLERKLINKLLSYLFESNSVMILEKILQEIKNYYFLDDIILFEQDHSSFNIISSFCYSSFEEIEYIKSNWLMIEKETAKQGMLLIDDELYLIKHKGIYILLVFRNAQPKLTNKELFILKEEISKIIVLAI